MKIVQVSHFVLDGGGREEHIYQISRQFAEKGHKVTVVSSDYVATGEQTYGRKYRKIRGIDLVILKGYPTDLPPGRIEIPDLPETLLGIDCDIIHAHGMGEQVAEFALYSAMVKRVPLVYTPHFHPAWTYEKLHAQSIWDVLQRTLTPMIIRNADACIAVSPPQKRDLIRYTGVSGRNITVIPNGVDQDIPTPSRRDQETVLEKYGIPPSENYIVFLGDISNPRKGAFEAVQTFRRVREKFPNTHLIMAGSWGDRFQIPSVTIQLINKMAKARYVTLTGYVPDEDKAALLARADLLLSPTVYEAFGIVIAESLYFGTPVVATSEGGVPYIVRHRRDGLLVKDQDDINRLTNACLFLLRDKKRARRMGRSGHDRVKRLFSWDKVAGQTLNLYTRLTKKSNVR